MYKLQFKDGSTATGTPQELIKLLEAEIEDGIHYKSATKGRIKISEMDSKHLQNAYLKIIRTNIEKAKGLEGQAFLNFMDEDMSLTGQAILRELRNRQKNVISFIDWSRGW